MRREGFPRETGGREDRYLALISLTVKYVTVPSDSGERACHLDWQHQIFLYLLKWVYS